MEIVSNFLKKYTLPPFTISSDNFTEGIFDLDIFYTYLQHVNEYIPWVLKNEEALISGLFAFTGSVLYSRLKGVGEKDIGILHFILLYINLDYILDDPKFNQEEKEQIVKECYLYLDTLDKSNIINSFTLASIKSLDYLLKETDVSIETLRECFIEEQKSCNIQTKENISREKLYKICISKAQTCLKIIVEILNVEEKYMMELATLSQLIDDMLDAYDDSLVGIQTVVTHDIKNGDLTTLILDLIGMIEKIPSVYMKIGVTYCVITYAATCPYLPESWREIFKIYYPFKWEGVEIVPNKFIRKFFYKTLCEMMKEEKIICK